jgi:hypothetical protein
VATVASNGIEEFKNSTCAKLRDVRCPVHRQPARIRFDGESLREVTVNLSGCCNRLLDLANRAIGSR